jgi:hypothetical protein
MTAMHESTSLWKSHAFAPSISGDAAGGRLVHVEKFFARKQGRPYPRADSCRAR